MKKRLLSAAFIALLLITGVIACQKDSSGNNEGKARLQVRLTDAPAAYDAVNIDIQKVMINTSEDTSTTQGWVELPLIHPGVYNLLDFRNGIDTVLADMEVPAGRINQIRLILGANNSVVIDGVEHELKTPSAQQSGLKLKLKADLTAGILYRLYIDFDASRSVVTAGNSGQYILKPVIRTYAEATGGSLKGFVLPKEALAQVWAIQNTDTLLALPDTLSGYYFFGGLKAGSWKVVFDAQAPLFRDSTINVNVTSGVVTDAGTLTLKP